MFTSQKINYAKKEKSSLSSLLMESHFLELKFIRGIQYVKYKFEKVGRMIALGYQSPIFTHDHICLSNIHICQFTSYLSVMINCFFLVCWWPDTISKIIRLIVPDSNHICPWDRIRSQIHIFSTKSIWKKGKGLGYTLKFWKYFTRMTSLFLLYNCFAGYPSNIL